MSSLNTLLDRAQRFAPEYAGRLSNHLPMALIALHTLGANDEQLDRGFANASRRLEPAPPTAEPCIDWAALRGQPPAFAAIHAYFVREISTHGFDAVLRRALPLLIDGVGGNAFHGLLRLGLATVARHDTEIASGLAHWACSHMLLAKTASSDVGNARTHWPATPELRTWLTDMTSAPTRWSAHDGMISNRMLAYSKNEAFQRTAPRLQIHDDTLRELATIALEHYLRSRNFTVLHLVTSAHAMRILSPYFDEPNAAIHHYAIAFAAGVAASGIDGNARALPATSRAWDELIAAACNADDEHEIKLVYASREEFLATGDDRYRAAAGLVLSRD